MFNGGNAPSLADIAAVTDNNRNNDGFGAGMGGWWVLIILLALFGGFGNGGWGNGNRNNSCDGGTTIVTVPTGGYGFGGGWGAFDAASMQRGFDTSGIIAKLDGIANGICSLGYDQLAQMNTLGNTVQQTSWDLSQQMQSNAVAQMQQFNALSTQLGECCCENRIGQMQIINAMDKNNCQTNWNLAQLGRDIMQNDDANFRQLNDTIRDGFSNLERQALMQENANLRQQLSQCDLDKALQGTASFIVGQVRPTPVPSYDVPNPWGCCSPWGNNSGTSCGGSRCG